MEERVPFCTRAVHQGLRLRALGRLVGQDAHDQQTLWLVLKVDAVVGPRRLEAWPKLHTEHRRSIVQGPLQVVVVLKEDHAASLASNDVHAGGIGETNATNLEPKTS